MRPIVPLNGLFMTSDLHLLEVMTKVLDKLCIKTVVCLSAKAAIQAARSQPFDCAFIDWIMNEDCFDVMSALRGNVRNEKTFVMAILEDNKNLWKAFKASVNLGMNKPQNYEQAIQFIRPTYGSMIKPRRESYRLPVKWNGTIISRLGLGKVAQITDISETGIAFKTSFPFQINDTVKVAFTIPIHGYGKVSATADVVCRSQEGTVGAVFTSIPPDQKALINHWVTGELHSMMSSHAANPILDHKLLTV